MTYSKTVDRLLKNTINTHLYVETYSLSQLVNFQDEQNFLSQNYLKKIM
jgi:hypothetical protein